VTHDHGRTLVSTGFDQDDGSADPELTRILSACRAGTANRHAVYPVLAGRRVLAPVVAVLGESAPAGTGAGGVALRRDKDSDMALVTLLAADGAKAVPVFTSTAKLAAWGAAAGLPAARPVPVVLEKAAQAALQEQADVLVIDPGTDEQFSLGGSALRAFAAGRLPVAPDADPEILDALRAALRLVPEVAGVLNSARIGTGAAAGAVLELGFAPQTDVATLAGPLRALAEVIGADPVLRDRLGEGLSIITTAGIA
jgi:SseB protein N-terminal domain